MKPGTATSLALACTALLLLPACGGPEEGPAGDGASGTARKEPDFVEVDHILIAYRDAPKVDATRSLEEAEALAGDLMARLQEGADWDDLKAKYTDDRQPTGALGGPYAMTNRGVAKRPGAFPRDDMAAAFGDVSFGLEVGGIGLAEHHPRRSPFGYHVIKRIR